MSTAATFESGTERQSKPERLNAARLNERFRDAEARPRRKQRAKSTGRRQAHRAGRILGGGHSRRRATLGARGSPRRSSTHDGGRALRRLRSEPFRLERDGRQTHVSDALESESEGRFLLPELRVARSRRQTQDGRVL